MWVRCSTVARAPRTYSRRSPPVDGLDQWSEAVTGLGVLPQADQLVAQVGLRRPAETLGREVDAQPLPGLLRLAIGRRLGQLGRSPADLDEGVHQFAGGCRHAAADVDD